MQIFLLKAIYFLNIKSPWTKNFCLRLLKFKKGIKMFLLSSFLIILCIHCVRPQTLDTCPTSFQYCMNGGTCLILNNVQLMCSCAPGFTGGIKNFF
jgi:hypothetical protein